MAVLVAFGSTGGGTEEIAAWIAGELRGAGLNADVMPAGQVAGVAGYEALVLGSSVYAMGWHPDVRHLVRTYAAELAGRPVWLFSSGPLDTSADHGQLPPGPHAAEAVTRLRAREHVTFGGRMTSDSHGYLGQLAHQAAREGHAGDFRNPDRVRKWARGIADELLPPASRDHPREAAEPPAAC